MSIKSLFMTALFAAAALTASADIVDVGVFTVGENKWKSTYTPSYAKFTAEETTTYSLEVNPGATYMGVLKFEIIESTGNLDSDLTSGQRVACNWVNGTQETSTTGSFEAVANQEYIFYQDAANWANFNVIIGKPSSNFTVSPDEGTKLDELSKVTVSFDGGIKATENLPTVYTQGIKQATFEKAVQIDSKTIELSLASPIRKTGSFEVVFPEGCFLMGEAETPSKEQKVIYELEYAGFLPVSTTPADGSTVDDITSVVFSFSENVYRKGGRIVSFYNESGEEVTGDFIYQDGDNSVIVRPKCISKKGKYRVVVPANSVGDAAWSNAGCEEGKGLSNPEFEIYINVSGRYSLVPESWEPKENSVLDYHGDVIKATFADPVFIVGDKKAVIYKNAMYEDPIEATLKVSPGNNKVVEIAYDTKLIPNHKYYFVQIPSGAISTDANGTGICNPQLTYNFTTSTGDIDYVISFTVRKPENAQTDALNSIELEASHDWSVFAEDVLDKVFLYKHGTTEIASTLSKFEFDRRPGSTDFRTLFIDLSKTITETGRYDLVIPQGVLGGENWYLGKEGISNMAQTIVFTVGDPGPENPDDPKDGITTVDSDNNATFDVYTLTGTLVTRGATESEISTLPAGIYFAKGRKFIVK